MGCDIHVHIEVKIDGEWHHYAMPRVKRDYDLFGRIAGVRQEDSRPLCKHKGLPSDATFMTRYAYESCPAKARHDAGWLNPQEIVLLSDWVRGLDFVKQFCPQFGYFLGSSWASMVRYPNDYKKKPDDFRFIFWFDN